MLLIFVVDKHGKDKKGITNTNTFQKIFDKSDRKPNKIWVDKSSEITIDQ